ncbi:MAG TPA: ATP-binding cassette domain-containing protein [Tepidisphaeraceae bacterium]|nr:ATP-binding cassette domain-containing protein [Tepidisphaeraceae bacterium]
MLVELTDSVFGYFPARSVVRVDGTVRLAPRGCLGVFGPNGAGKTTLVRGLLGLLPPMGGIVRRSESTRRGYLPQHRAIDPHWPMSAVDAATLATSGRRRFGWAIGCGSRVRRSMDLLEVSPLAERPFAKLSGGQQQRVLLAGALADDPDLLVLDEPTDGLDLASRDLLLGVLRGAIAGGLGAVVVSHNADDILALCQTVLWLEPAREPDASSVAHEIPADSLYARLSAGRAP